MEEMKHEPLSVCLAASKEERTSESMEIKNTVKAEKSVRASYENGMIVTYL